MKIFFRYILLSTTLLLTLTAKSQRFPVQANVQLLPPYSISLADYASPEVDRVRLSLLLLDLTQPTYDVRLRLVIEGTGIRIETNPAFNPAPITIESGAPTILTGIDLAPYFDIRNLLFSGISKQQYERQGVLPEGFYRFTLQVTDARRRDRVLARDAFAQAWLALGEPPLLNTPFCGSEVRINEGQQNVLFSWTPIGISPNAAMGTEYEFTLVEVRPSGRNPNDAINASRHLYRVTTDATSLVYGITEPPLLEGVTYAWRIRAIDRNGLDRFKNQGFSKVCSFIVPEEEVPLGAPTDVSASPETERSARVTWRTVPEGNGYRVEYREADNPNAEWFGTDDPTQDGELIVNDLRPATEYEARVAGLRSNFAGTWSETVTFTTFPPRVFECGDPATVSGPTNTEPLMTALVGSVFKVGEFDMVVTSIQGGNGTFSGTGAVLMPFLGFRINSRFTNIKVNELQEVIDGEVIALSDGVEGLIDRWEGDGDTDLDGNGNGLDIGEGTDGFAGEDVTVDGTIDTVYVNDGGDIVVVTEDGNTEIVDREVDEETGEAEDDIRITDSDGNQIIIDKDGNTLEVDNNGSGNGAVPVAADSLKYLITFAPGDDQKYGFDAHDERYPSLKTEYVSSLVHGSTVSVPWKSVAAGNIDRVKAKSEEGPISKELAFKGELGPINILTGTDPNEKSLMVTGRGDGQEETISAYLLKEDEEGKQREEIQGQLNVVSYDQVRKQVYLVNVDGNGDNINTGVLRNELNSIYGQAVVQWELSTIALNNVDWDLKEDGMLDDGTTGTFSNYTKEMKVLIKALERQGDIEKDAYYLFAMKKSASGRKLGFMPRKKQFGFIFIEGLGGNDIPKVVAHELAHGAFRLKHTFNEYPEMAQGSTDNLLDYGPGSRLMKWQWDLIHDPVAMIGWLDSDEEAAYDLTSELYQKILQEVRCAYLDNETTYQSDYLRRLPDSRPTFDVGTLQLGSVEIEDIDMYFDGKYPNGNKTELPTRIQGRYYNPNWAADYYEYKLGNLHIITDEASPELVKYLQSSSEQVEADLIAVMKDINLKGSDISGKSFDQLFAIASCATRYLRAEQRIQLIKLILKEESTVLDEDYEDLILDILMTTSESQAKEVYKGIMNQSDGLLSDLIAGIDNIGDDEDNYNRLSNEIYRLFQLAYKGEELDFAHNLIVPSSSEGSICPYKAKVKRSGFSFTVSGQKKTKIERTVNGRPGAGRPSGYGGSYTAAYTTDCGYVEDQELITLQFDEVISVVFEEDMLNGQTPRRYQMPAFMYYQIIDARRNQELYKGLDAAWMALGIVTPIDEFYILTKALSLGRRAAYTVNLFKLKVALKESKLILSDGHYDEILKASRNVMDNVDQYIVKAGFPDFPRINNLTPELKTVIKEKGWDNDILTKFNDNLANSAFKAGVESDFNLVNAWEGAVKVGANPTLLKNPDFLKDFAVVRRNGSYGEYFTEIEIKSLTKAHGAPKAGTPDSYIEELSQKLAKDGYDLEKSLPVIELPDGKLLVADGHHRLKALENNLGQKFVPIDKMSVREAKQLYGVDQNGVDYVTTLVEVSKLSGNYKGAFRAAEGVMLEDAKAAAIKFMDEFFTNWRK